MAALASLVIPRRVSFKPPAAVNCVPSLRGSTDRAVSWGHFVSFAFNDDERRRHIMQRRAGGRLHAKVALSFVSSGVLNTRTLYYYTRALRLHRWLMTRNALWHDTHA